MADANSNPYLNSDYPSLRDALEAVCAYTEGNPTTEQADAMALVRKVNPKYFEALEARARCSRWREVAEELGVTEREARWRFEGGLALLMAMLDPDFIV